MRAINTHGQSRPYNRLSCNWDRRDSPVTCKDDLLCQYPHTVKAGRVAFIVRRHGYSCTSDNIVEGETTRLSDQDDLHRF